MHPLKPAIGSLILLLFVGYLQAQQATMITIRGRVVDKGTNEPLPYASVGIKGKSIGTVANADGAFVFHIPTDYARDTLFISFIGYKSYQAIVEQEKQRNVFLLTATPMLLTEVVVGIEPSPREIVQRAFDRIAINYPMEPYILKGFFRDWSKNQMPESYVQQYGIRQSASLLEAAVQVYDEGYHFQAWKRSHEEVYVQELRKSQSLPGNWSGFNEMRHVLRENYIKYPEASGNGNMLESPWAALQPNFPVEYVLLNMVEEQGERLYVIEVAGIRANVDRHGTKHRKPDLVSQAAYRIYISQEDYAILRVDLFGSTADAQGNPDGTGRFLHQSRQDSRFKWIYVDNTIRFRRYQGKLFPAYFRTYYKTRKLDEATGAVLEGYDFHKELLVNDILTENIAQQRQDLGKPVKDRQTLASQMKTYHPAFWAHYNLLQQNPLERETQQLLETEKELDEQFHQQTPTN